MHPWRSTSNTGQSSIAFWAGVQDGVLLERQAEKESNMTPEQIAKQTHRLFLEEQIVTTQKYLWDLKKECKEHVIVKGRILFSPAKNGVVNTHENHVGDCYSASCAVCGEDFGWWCPKSPTHYCEYDETDTYGCKWCHEPDERK